MPRRRKSTPRGLAIKMKSTADKRPRSICATIIRSPTLTREKLYECIPKIHPDIEKIHLSRHKRPKFIFVVCKEASAMPSVRTALRNYKNEDIGTLFPRKQRNASTKIEFKAGESDQSESDEDEQPKKVATRSVIDPSKLVIASLPEQITEKMVYEVVPKCSKITMFKTAMRPLLLEFKKPDDAYKAFEIISKTPIQGIKLNVKYHRVQQAT